MQDLLQTISRIIHQINVSMYIILRIIMRFNDDREMRQVTIFRSELFTIAHRSQFINGMILPNHSHDSPIPRSIIVQDPRSSQEIAKNIRMEFRLNGHRLLEHGASSTCASITLRFFLLRSKCRFDTQIWRKEYIKDRANPSLIKRVNRVAGSIVKVQNGD